MPLFSRKTAILAALMATGKVATAIYKAQEKKKKKKANANKKKAVANALKKHPDIFFTYEIHRRGGFVGPNNVNKLRRHGLI